MESHLAEYVRRANLGVGRVVKVQRDLGQV